MRYKVLPTWMEERRLRDDKQLARGAPLPQFSVAPSLLKDFDPQITFQNALGELERTKIGGTTVTGKPLMVPQVAPVI